MESLKETINIIENLFLKTPESIILTFCSSYEIYVL